MGHVVLLTVVILMIIANMYILYYAIKNLLLKKG